MNPSDVVDNSEGQRFELTVGAHLAFVQYQRMHGLVVLTHTEVPQELEGMGVGSALARGALDMLVERGANVLPICPFVHEFIREHTEYLELVSDRYRLRSELDTAPES